MKRSFSIIVIAIALSVLGLALIPRLPVKLMPSRTLPSLTVSYRMPRAAARVVESEVTSRLESMLARVTGVKNINSTSENGGGRITIELDKHADINQARFEASTIVRQAWSQLPDGVSYPSVSAARTIAQSARPVLSYTINAPGSSADIMQYAEENVRPVLGRIPGINRVQLSGATPMEWHLEYDSDKLQSLGITPADIQSAISQQSASQYLGINATEAGQWLAVSSKTSATDGDDFDLSRIFVTTADSSIVSLDKILTARREESAPLSYYRINGLNSIYCNIYADEEANQLEVAAKTKAALAEMKLPAGYRFNISSDATESISSELNKIYFRSGLTLLILLVFVALITLNWRYMAVISISLAVSLAVAVIFYYLLGIEIQLYSLAGITISLNLIIDNIIVMSDALKRRARLWDTFPAILAATLTTIGAMGIVFFLDDELRLNLQDFVAVVIINLVVSLAATLFLVPALMERLHVEGAAKRLPRRHMRLVRALNRAYGWFIRVSVRRRWAFLTVIVLAFGLPVFMLPKEVPDCAIYNKTLGSHTYNDKIRPWVNRLLGGTLRLFVDDVYEGSYFNRDDNEPVLQIGASLPNGSTIEQMNELIKRMEAYLATYPEIRQFRTNVYSANQANISVSFTRKAARTSFPYQLKSDVVSKALTLGGGSWSVFGLEDRGFSNDVTERNGSYQVKLTGYNYDELEQLAESFRQKLLGHRRIKEVTVSSEFSWYKSDYTEYALSIDKAALAEAGLSVSDLYGALQPVFGRDLACGYTAQGSEQIILSSRQSKLYDVWSLENLHFTANGSTFKIADFATVERSNAAKSIAKENQQYCLCLQYEYIGSMMQGDKMLKQDIEEFRTTLPMGYQIENPRNGYSWGDASSSNYWLLLLVIAIIFFTAAILFNSLRLPLIIIAMIPISFIGLFLAFYLTKMNFDQGGFAAFVLLAGITVNAAIYLLTEYRRERASAQLPAYQRAFRAKITPIMLTVVSTILGFIPFMVGADGREAFWFPLALGTIGGLLMSLLALLLYLPLLTLSRKKVAPRKVRGAR
jgi:multidrug efflux pump subunit AcrB